jgi:hypothetical protein
VAREGVLSSNIFMQTAPNNQIYYVSNKKDSSSIKCLKLLDKALEETSVIEVNFKILQLQVETNRQV